MGVAVRYNGAQPERLGGSNVHRAPRFRSTRFHPARSRATVWVVVRPVPGAGEIETFTFGGGGTRRRFDPTGHGSLFWTDEELREMGADGLAEIAVGIQGATEMLEYCRRTQLGVYLRIVSRRTNA
jgi:hypothetical protein